jgi:hypothetical protein
LPTFGVYGVYHIWAYKAAKAFANEWMDRMGLTRVYEIDLNSFDSQIQADGL